MTDLEDWFEERAAIMEYDGGITREQAEIEAWKDTLENHKKIIIDNT